MQITALQYIFNGRLMINRCFELKVELSGAPGTAQLDMFLTILYKKNYTKTFFAKIVIKP